MPIYEYECLSCLKDFEVIRKISDQEDVACPLCGATKLKKKVAHVNTKGWSTFIDGMEEKIKSPHVGATK